MTRRDILIVDDERTVRTSYRILFEREGYSVRLARSGAEALRLFSARRPDLVLLDVDMADMNGYAVCKAMRAEDAKTPIVFLTAMESDADQLRGLGLGADDYVFKSASNSVLLARVASTLARHGEICGAGRFESRRIDVGRAVVDLDSLSVCIDGRPTREKLTKTEADILRVLVAAEGRLLSDDEIVSAMRGKKQVMEPSTLRSHITHLRAKLGTAGSLLVNEAGAGYRFVCTRGQAADPVRGCGRGRLACAALALVCATLAAFASAAPGAKPAEDKWTLRYTEDFKGRKLNTKLWSRIPGQGGSGPDWLKNMSPRADLVEVRDGVLVLKGVANSDREADPRRVLTGGVSTQGRFNIKYGKVEARVKLEDQKGAWPAIWMMPERSVKGWPADGEIDIIERLNSDTFVYQTVHSSWTQHHPGDPPQGGRGEIKPGKWNVYSVEWSPEKIVWHVNGKETHSYAKIGDSRERWPWDAPFYLMIDMQLGGNWVGSIDESTLPVEMQVDWVKFYQLERGRERIGGFSKPASAAPKLRSSR